MSCCEAVCDSSCSLRFSCLRASTSEASVDLAAASVFSLVSNWLTLAKRVSMSEEPPLLLVSAAAAASRSVTRPEAVDEVAGELVLKGRLKLSSDYASIEINYFFANWKIDNKFRG